MARKLSARRKEETVDIELENGTVHSLIVRELMGDDREEYLAYQAGKVKLDKKGRPIGMGDMRGITNKLLTLGLFWADRNVRLTEAEIDGMVLPGRVKGELARMLIEMSGLGDDAEEEAKNA